VLGFELWVWQQNFDKLCVKSFVIES
jgi:hypothetical protein